MARRLFVVRVFQVLAALVLLVLSLPASAFADDWLVTKLRGEALQLVGNDWAPLNRGDVVPDDRVIRTLASGRAMLQRDGETIEIAANTQIRIFDKAGGKHFTVVQQHFGTVAIEAEVRNVQHFAVQTPYLAAVVKGTRFEVKTTARHSQVKVQRGLVAVEDDRSGASTRLAAGQTATVGKDGSFIVGGKGTKPVILDEAGQPVDPEAAANGLIIASANNGGVNASAGAGGSGANVTVDLPGVAGVNGNAGGNGVGATVTTGGGGHGASVTVGGAKVKIGLGGLL